MSKRNVPEFYNLINPKINIPIMERVPSLSEFDTKIADKSVLSKFHLDKLRAKEVDEMLMMTAAKTMLRTEKDITKYYTQKCHQIMSQKMCYKKIHEFANKLPTIGLLPTWERKIKRLVPKKLRKKFRRLFDSHMTDTKALYVDEMHRLGVKFVIAGENWQHMEERPFKFDGRTVNRPRFIKNRDNLAMKYFHSHKLMQNIFQKPLDLPEFICDFTKYRDTEFIVPSTFFDAVDADIEKGASIIRNNYYKYIVTLVTTKRYVNDVPSYLLPSFLHCSSKFVAYQIIVKLMNSIQHILDVMDNWLLRPTMKFELTCENNDLFIVPLKNDFFTRFHNLIDKIANFGATLRPLEFWMNIKTEKDFISALIPEWYMNDVHRRLTEILGNWWESLDSYVNSIQEKFQMVYSNETRGEIEAFITGDNSFKDCLLKVEDFNEFIHEIEGTAENEYLEVGKINQGVAKVQLKNYATSIREHIIDELLTRHRRFNNNICSTFQEVKTRLLNIPDTTKELLELGQFLTYAKTIFMEDMREKINSSLFKMASFFETTTFSADDIELNNETVNWLSWIKPIFERSSSMYEQMKFDLEEKLQKRIDTLSTTVEEKFSSLIIMDDMDDANRIREYIEDMRKLVRILERLDEEVQAINNEEELFHFPLTSYPRIKELKDLIFPFYELIYKALKWQRDCGVWLDGPFEYLDANIIENRTNDYYADFSKISKSYKTKLKMQIATGYKYTFAGSLDDPDPLQHPAPMKLCFQLLEDIKWFKKYVPLAAVFCNPALRQRHWDDMSIIAGFDITPNAGTTFRKIIEQDLMSDLGQYETISVSASREYALQEFLHKIMQDWDNVLFNTMEHKDSGVAILTQVDDIQSLLEEHIVKIQAMRGSAFVKPIESEVRAFYELLLRIQKTLDEWTKVQIEWMYLLPIFSSKDIVAQLPEEGVMFQQVNATFRNAMQSVAKERRVKIIAGSVGLCESMEKANELMERVHEGVVNYLEKKRLFFPRFFFLSNEDMLEILSETKDPLRVQPHLNKCFEGIVRLGFNDDLEIYSMFSDDNEEVKMQQVISTSAASGCVERWLAQVEEQMIKSIRHEIMVSYFDYEVTDRVQWVLIWPGQVVLCVSQIYWSLAVGNCLMTHTISTIESLYESLKSQMNDMVHLVRGKLTKQNRTTLNALITIDVHAQDVVKLLIDKGIIDETDFEWMAQLRYYWEDDVLVRIINATVPYAYEYLGNCPRLVITPLTDRCYRTLIGAYALHLNGAPEGPAGTGKTETTKDLARAIAVQCVVFNCSEGLDYKNMGKFFKGLASCGAWACFDEFNRIELEVLSVVAQQILCIIQAVRANVKTFVFEGTELNLNSAVYVCITMNPGYAGRSELPDNLKVLFRTVAMMVPDYAMIGEIFLYSSGFNTARVLSVKIVTTYKLCSEQLSTQSHYDYGMRAVKTVLTAAQNFKLKYPHEDEMILLLRSIIDVNLPKFLAHDIPLFQGIISDLFPGLILPPPDYETLIKAVKIVAKQRNLQAVDGFLLKIIQTYEMMIVRHGFMLVGDPFGGKTSVLHTLAESLSLMAEWGDDNGANTVITTINPKSITMGQLYGQFDPISSEWTDGVAAVTFRQYCMDESTTRKWLIFDGPVDAVWIENLNTVLDDNKKLCLTSGEVMQMTGVMSMIFEAMDLHQASPATVSRCGMIYIEPQVLGWRPFVQSWYNTLNTRWCASHKDTLHDLFEWLIQPTLNFIDKKCNISLYAGQINQIVSTLNLFTMLINDAVEENDFEEYIQFWFQATILLSIIWGLGGTLDRDSHNKLNDFLVRLWKNEVNDLPVPQSITETISLPSEGIIHDNYYNFMGKGAWKYYGDAVKAEKFIETASIGQMIIPTIDTIKYQSFFLKHIKHQKRFLLYGETGTGKSFYIQDLMMNKLGKEKFLPNLVTFTARTSAAAAQELVISKLFRRRKGHYGPMGDLNCVVFIDDVNMPIKEEYGAQPAIELLRQVFDHGHWYDLKSPEKILIFDTMFVCAMCPPGGSRQEVYRRFLRHFNLLSINNFSDDSIFRIYYNLALVGLKRHGFAISDVSSIVSNLVNATLNIFKQASEDLRPTPTKSHYLFNLRDFSRVITGCAMIKKESIESKTTFTRLWVHEILRVFGDRLIADDDRQWLFEHVQESVQKIMKESFDVVFDDLPKFNDKISQSSLQSLIFGNFMDLDAVLEDRKYQEIESMEEFKNIVMQSLDYYNTTHRNKMDIVPFRYALEHLARVCRILATPGGSLLMVGVGGSGRQSLTRLAASMAGYGIFQPEIGSAYGLNEWREDIKGVLKNSGAVGKDLVFLFTEGQIKEEVFLTDIDSLLNSGEVPNLFNVEERQEIVELCRLAAQGGDRNLDISILSVLSFFVNRCKEKLHLMLCFSPIGESFRTRLRLYPSLVNCCTIDWFEVWPEDALEQVAIRFTTDINVDENVKINAVIACKYFHVCAKKISEDFYAKTGRKTYITSAAFLDLIRSYADLMKQKQEEIIQARDRYLNGLDKLAFAAEQIAKMKITLEALKPQLETSARETTETMMKIEYENKIVEEASILVKKDEDTANIQAKIAGSLKAECEADLASALPILEDALAALNILKPADISLVKTMKNPPEGVKLVMAAICVMLNVPPIKIIIPETGKTRQDYWQASKKILGDMKFLENLRNFDKDNISNEIIQTVEKTYLSNKNFEPTIVAKASQAAQGLCKWVRAMVLYDKVIKDVAPKKAKLAAAEKDYEDIMDLLNEKRRTLAELNEKLALLKDNLQKTLNKKLDLEQQVSNCQNKLIRAKKLISGLGGEKERWLSTADELQKSYDTLPGDILLSCGMIAYLGPFTTPYRLDNIEKWCGYVKNLGISCSMTFVFTKILGSEIKVNSWNIFGLPRDAFSTENAIIMSNSKRWSLFIDPQSQANKWIRNMEKQSELEVIKLTDKNYMKIIEQCIEYGKPVLIENIVEQLDAPLDPILTKNVYKIAGEWYITLGEKVILYDQRFRLYMTTKLRNPHYLPEVFNKVTLINFALTVDGLEDQLLGIVVAKERPDLQEKREYLIIQSAANKKALKQVEDNILRTLSNSGNSILEDEEAIEILDSSKILSIDIVKKQETSKDTEKKIELFRQSYTPIAQHSSSLYYTLTDLPNIDPMYQYSLSWFINLYVISIDTANKSKVLERRLMFLRDTFTYNLYQNVCRSLFEKDKVLYSFILYTTILLASREINRDELMFFLSGGVAIGRSDRDNPASDWLPDRAWEEISRVGQLSSFTKFIDSFCRDLDNWKIFYDALNPDESSLPQPWEVELTAFEKLIIMRMIRPDKVTRKVIQFVEAGMGRKFVIPPAFNIAKSYADSNCLIPLIFILSPGSDPMGALSNFAESIDAAARFHSISLGQGQGPIARELIKQAQHEGSWICLQNCHLAVSWMPELEKICENFDSTNTSMDFRLWLTSYPSEKFPISILEYGVKMTNEPPGGLQQNLMRSYTSEPVKNSEFYNGCPGKDGIFTKLLYALCFFHALVQERRNYGAQGWNIRYGFNESDFQISVQQLQIFINEYQEVPFKAIIYLTGECNYGGRVTDDRDRRCLLTILEDFYNPEVINNPNYLFSNNGAEYGLPKKIEYHDYIKQISDIPMNPSPEVLGLHINAGMTRELEVSKTFFESMLKIQGTIISGDVTKQDELLLAMKKDIYQRLPPVFNIEEAKKRYPIVYTESMNTVLIQEMQRYNILLREIRWSLEMLEKAVQGLVVMTPELEILSKYIINGKVPPSWLRASAYPSLKSLPSFVIDFIERLEFFANWLVNGKPKTFWIAGFSFVHAFLTGAMQNYARKYRQSIDKIDFDFEVMSTGADDPEVAPDDGVYVYGIYLVGGRWSREKMTLAESYPKILWDSMPIIWLKPCESLVIERIKRYQCPLYITSARFGTLKTTGHSTNYVLMFLLDTELPVRHWIKRGLALLCQLDD